MSSEKYVKVAVKGVSYHFDTEYSYLLPEKYCACVRVGTRVEVPFGRGNKRTPALVLYIGERSEISDEIELKSIAALLDEAPLFNDELMSLVSFLKDTTFCTSYDAAKCMLPVGIDLKSVVTVTALKAEEDTDLCPLSPAADEIYGYLRTKGKYVTLESVNKALGLDNSSDAVEELLSMGLIARNIQSVRKVGDSSIRFAQLTDETDFFNSDSKKLTVKQHSVVNLLHDIGSASVKEICYFTGVTEAVISGLEKKGIVRFFEREVMRRPKFVKAKEDDGDIELNEEQETAYNTIRELYNKGNAAAALLYGVTGSGKTQVYLKLIDDTVKQGKGVIVMVPEISLTPQALSIFYSRFGDMVAVFHSGLSAGERLDEWKRVKDGKARIALGTRSAVFAPMDNLGLIVMDEEQEHTYKSSMTPKYHARDVAKFRCAYNNALLLLCSATPSIESYKHALDGKYTLVSLNERFGSSVLPEVTTVDTSGLRGSLSNELYDKLEECLNNKNQAILLINRRGFNTFASCSSCKRVAVCPSCSISLTYHKSNDRLMCHYCGYSRPYTTTCEYCNSEDIHYYGAGTQKIEDELQRVFPEASVLRMDADTTSSRYSYDEKLSAFSSGKYDILIGTQMVAKGLDFPNVTLVGVISVDRELYSDDFRSAERTFDLLTQVIGRSGRRETPGEALIQSVLPDNEIITLAARQDYAEFYKTEIEMRKLMLYPPFCDICTVMFSSENEMTALSSAKYFLKLIIDAVSTEYSDVAIKVLGPIKPRIEKINNKHRHKLTVKCKNNKRFRQMMSSLIVEYMKKPKKPSAAISVDMNSLE